MPWELSGRDLCRAVMAKHGIEQGATACKVVVEANYGRDDPLLQEINHIWGSSYHGWTPLLLRMSTLFGRRGRESNQAQFPYGLALNFQRPANGH
jgi:hypothetical protein